MKSLCPITVTAAFTCIFFATFANADPSPHSRLGPLIQTFESCVTRQISEEKLHPTGAKAEKLLTACKQEQTALKASAPPQNYNSYMAQVVGNVDKKLKTTN